METRYKIELDFDELNVLLKNCISDSKIRMKSLKKRLVKSGLTPKEADAKLAFTLQTLNRLHKNVLNQLYEQGSTLGIKE